MNHTLPIVGIEQQMQVSQKKKKIDINEFSKKHGLVCGYLDKILCSRKKR
jgi:hypothetical protein